MRKAVWLLATVLLVDSTHGLEWWNASELAAVTQGQAAGSGRPPLYVPLTLIRSAAAKGALCLDGSLPAYHLHRGHGSGANNWIVNLEGGGWCNDIRTCVYRKKSRHGSSHFMEQQLQFSGILSDKPEENPDFYSWNRVKIRYCDGASFTGEGYHTADAVATHPLIVHAPSLVKLILNHDATGLYFRGQRIWQAAIEELMSLGLRNAKQALLSGCSAGGLATIHHCDGFRALLPRTTVVKCLADAGMFLDAADVSGGHTLKSLFAGVVSLQGSWRNLQRSCTSRMHATSCFFPQNVLGSIQTPLFLLNAAYDVWQIQESLATAKADPSGHWKQCRLNYSSCDSNQLQFLQGFRNQMLNAVKGPSMSRENGIFINSCFAHCQTERQGTWFEFDSPTIGNKRIATAVADWFFDRAEVKATDCPYPCDRTCHNLVFRRTID